MPESRQEIKQGINLFLKHNTPGHLGKGNKSRGRESRGKMEQTPCSPCHLFGQALEQSLGFLALVKHLPNISSSSALQSQATHGCFIRGAGVRLHPSQGSRL